MNLTPKCRFGGHQRTASNERWYCSTISYHCAVLHLMMQSLLKNCMESGTSVSGQFPANARCLHPQDGPTQRIFIWPLSGESKLYLNDVEMSRSLQVPASWEAPCTRCGSPHCTPRIKPSAGGGFCTRRPCNGDLAPCRIFLGSRTGRELWAMSFTFLCTLAASLPSSTTTPEDRNSTTRRM